jgi:molecular chaperone DnaJ
MPIDFIQATLGAHVEAPTLDNEAASIIIPRGTQHGTRFTIKGAGLPNLRSGKRGDLVIGVKVEIPKKLTDRQEKLLREYAETTEKDEGLLPEVEGFWKKIRSVLGVKGTD